MNGEEYKNLKVREKPSATLISIIDKLEKQVRVFGKWSEDGNVVGCESPGFTYYYPAKDVMLTPQPKSD